MTAQQKGSDRASIHTGRTDAASEIAASARRPYRAPRLLSAEDLEAAAATCDPPAGGVGKAPPICSPGTLGS